jgi:hypothetical protein
MVHKGLLHKKLNDIALLKSIAGFLRAMSKAPHLLIVDTLTSNGRPTGVLPSNLILKLLPTAIFFIKSSVMTSWA